MPSYDQQTAPHTQQVTPEQRPSQDGYRQPRGNAFAQQALNVQSHYTVVAGDTLWGIATRFLGSGHRWQSIYEQNRDVIGDNPDRIYPGQRLRIRSAQSSDQEAKQAEDTGPSTFDQIVSDDLAMEEAPEQVELPPTLVEGMQEGWEGSLPNGQAQEQGGILVRNQDGSYEWKAGDPGNSGSFSINFDDVKEGEALVGTGHTHPYSEDEGGHTDVTFSGGDLANLVWQDVRMKIVQSGDAQFVVTKTTEWDARVEALDEAGREDLQDDIRELWNDTFSAATGTFQERCEAAVRAVCSTYDLVYYRGSGGTVDRVGNE